jgi:hypothetical protein
MQLRSFTGEDAISELCTSAMIATTKALVRDGLITDAQALEFQGRHIAVLTSQTGFWKSAKKWFGWGDDAERVVILEVL